MPGHPASGRAVQISICLFDSISTSLYAYPYGRKNDCYALVRNGCLRS